MPVRSPILYCVAAAALCTLAHAQPPAAPAAQPAPAAAAPQLLPPQPAVLPGLPTVPLQPLLDRIGRDERKRFVVDGRVSPDVYLGSVRADDVTYPLLLSILRANGIAAASFDAQVNVLPLSEIRWTATPIVQEDRAGIAPDEWVTRVLETSNVDTAGLVPVLRPLLPVWAHLSAMPPSRLIVVDRYANVQRITAIVRSLDQPGVGRPRDP